MEVRLAEQEAASGDLGKRKKGLEIEIGELKANVDEVGTRLSKSDAENKSKENQIRKLQDEMAQQDDKIAKLMKEKKRLEEANATTGSYFSYLKTRRNL